MCLLLWTIQESKEREALIPYMWGASYEGVICPFFSYSSSFSPLLWDRIVQTAACYEDWAGLQFRVIFLPLLGLQVWASTHSSHFSLSKASDFTSYQGWDQATALAGHKWHFFAWVWLMCLLGTWQLVNSHFENRVTAEDRGGDVGIGIKRTLKSKNDQGNVQNLTGPLFERSSGEYVLGTICIFI